MIHEISFRYLLWWEKKLHLKLKLSKMLDIERESSTVLTLKNGFKFKFNAHVFYIIKNSGYTYGPEFRYSQIDEIKIDTENNLFIIDDWIAIKYD